MYRTKFLIGLIVFVIGCGYVWACEPCPLDYRTDLSGSIAEADIIAVVQRDYDSFENERPETIKLRVSSLLKGSFTGETITAFSRVGETCPYGIIIDDDSRHLVLLQKGNGAYNPVHQGCGVGVLPVVDGKVQIDDKEIELEAFVEQRGLDMSSTTKKVSWFTRLYRWLWSE